MADVFNTLNAINVNDRTEKKNGLTYLSWAWAWGEVKKRFPDASYHIYENPDGWIYHTDGRTCWVKTGVTIDGSEMIEYLPVMDFKNNSIPLDKVTSFDVNKAVQRSLTKAIARHGLGLYIYAGEDLPEDSQEEPEAEKPAEEKPKKQTKTTSPKLGEEFGKEIMFMFQENGVKPETIFRLYGIKCFADMTEKQLDHAKDHIGDIHAKQDEFEREAKK